MTKRRALVFVLAIAGLAACAVAPGYPDRGRTLRVRPKLDEGPVAVAVADDGALIVTLPFCRQEHVTIKATQVETVEEACPDPLDSITVVAPWGRSVHTAVDNHPGEVPRARVVGDWGEANLDPLDRRTWSAATKPWRIEHPLLRTPAVWIPTEPEIDRLTRAIGNGRGIDASVVATVSQPPQLVVRDLQVSNNELLAGGTSVVALTVENVGQGAAYRVYAQVRSSVPALHGMQFSFGKLAPGQVMERRLSVEIPANVTDGSAMLVLVFAEANGFEPANVSKRFPMKVVATAPRLAVTCVPVSGSLEVDAGEGLRLRCTIQNDGGRLATGVEITGAMSGAPANTTVTVGDIPPRTTRVVELPVRVPSNAAVDQQVAIEVATTEVSAALRSTTRLVVTVRRPRLCPTGRIDRAQYLSKRRALEEAKAAGDLTAEEFDRYDAELVGCLAQ